MSDLRTAATEPAPNCWKVIDDTGDEGREYEEAAEYYQVESDAYDAFEKIIAKGGSARLYSGVEGADDEEVMWELEESTDEDDEAAPPVRACCQCHARSAYLMPSGECPDCYPIAA